MASQDRPPAPPKRPAADQQQADLVTYKRRRFRPITRFANMLSSGGNSNKDGRDPLARHRISWRDTLEGFLQSPGVSQGGGIQKCIWDALRCNGCQPMRPVSNGVIQTEPKGSLSNCQGAAKEHRDGVAEDKVVSAADAACLETNKAMCSYALFDILVSEQFALLCHLLVGTFHVNKPGEVVDLEKIDAKMRNGNYAQNPALFYDDIQQMWEKFERVGHEMTGLAGNLSTISRVSYQKQAFGFSEVEVAEHRTEEISLAGAAHIVTKESTTTMQFTPCDSSHSTIAKRIVPYGLGEFCPYDGCGTKVFDQEGLICDGCDTMYHFACVKLQNPDIEQVPATWHCSSCSFKKKELAADIRNNVGHDSLHSDNCNLCDQLELMKPEENAKLPSRIELAEERVGSSVSSMGEDNEPDLSTTALSNLCKHCGTCEDDDKKFIVCGHPYCIYKGCFQDKDDDKIVMCDGCDEGAKEGMHKYENSVLAIHRNNKNACNVNQSKVFQGDGPEN
ncbi:hypothetical protein GUJ93_ZPchr0010g9180 [Zizania palustris]|uniref:PHD-type domain-containing protein n=1 Tax=Zizania palustris TaxID=103762 RepID=A0A8J6BEH1_ZIZPA|nr:hypothetical protein GUJ93_ZPchr0010g9180 [Zizania palustris]